MLIYEWDISVSQNKEPVTSNIYCFPNIPCRTENMPITQKQIHCVVHVHEKHESFAFYRSTVKMSLCCWLALVTLIPMTLTTNPGVEVKLTEKGLEYGKHCSTTFFCKLKRSDLSSNHQIFLLLGRQLGMASIQKKLQTIKVPDISGKERVSPIGKVQYSLSK